MGESEYYRGVREAEKQALEQANKKAEKLGFMLQSLAFEAKAARARGSAAAGDLFSAPYHRRYADGIDHAVKEIATALGYRWEPDDEAKPDSEEGK